MVNIKEFNNIKEYLVANPDGTYEQWFSSYKPKREKAPTIVTEYDEQWNEWWNTYPNGTSFKYKDYQFTGTRSLHIKEQVCKNKYIDIVKSGISPAVLLKALQVEIVTRKEESWKHWKKENKLEFMSGTEPYLNGHKYRAYIDRELPMQISAQVSVMPQSSSIDI